MRLLLIISLLLTATVANAQVPELTIKTTPAEADLIWKGLRELPVKDVESLMAKIRQQIAEQTAPKVEEKK